MKNPQEITLKVNVEVERVENEDRGEKVVLGYSPGDSITVGGNEHTISNVDFTCGWEEKESTIRISTEKDLVISGRVGDVSGILDE